MKIPTICRYCGGVIRLVPARKIYGASTDRLGLKVVTANIYYPIAQAKAWLSGHTQVEPQDLLALKNYLW